MVTIRRLILPPQRLIQERRPPAIRLRLPRRCTRTIARRRRDRVIAIRELVVAARSHTRDIRVRAAAVTTRRVLRAVPANGDLAVAGVVGVVALEGVWVGRADGLDGGHLAWDLALALAVAGVGAGLVARAAAGAWFGGLKDGDLA
jgi:hypothetical protein